MAYLTHCCCGCMTVRTGTKVLAILSVVGSLLGLITYSTVAVNFKKVQAFYEDFPELHDLVESSFGLVVAYAVICAIGLVVSSLCVHGAYTDKRHFLMPYLVFDGIVLAIQAILAIITVVVVVISGATQALGLVFTFILSLCLGIYFFIVVLSFYKELAYAARNPGVPMVPAGQSVPPGMYVAPPGYSPAAPAPQYYPESKTGVV
ncbi:unnamed protein product [Ixodes hexagonus]